MSRPPSDEVLVQVCIGCGAVETPQPCLGTCVDRRLELVPASDHEAVLAEAEALGALRELVRELRESRGGEEVYRPLQARARALLHAYRPAAEDPDARLTTWACDSCGRIEAPQPCIGVCIRQPARMVEAGVYDAALARLRGLRREAEPLLPLARRLAWATPRTGQWERGLDALAAEARAPGS